MLLFDSLLDTYTMHWDTYIVLNFLQFTKNNEQYILVKVCNHIKNTI